MLPTQAIFLRDFLLPQLQSESVVTAKIISAVPAGQSDFKPNEKCFSAFRLSWHIALCEMWLLDAVIHREFRDTDPRPDELKTCADVAAWYTEQFSQRIPLLKSLTGEQLIVPVPYIELRNDPAVAYLNIAIRHAVHHRGQLSTYLRCMGAHVPAIYVESADEPYPPDPGSAAAESDMRPPAF